MGFNAVEAALGSGRRTVERLFLEKGRHRGRILRLKSLARSRSVPVEEVDRGRLERLAGGKPRSAHQGVIASVAGLPYVEAEALLEGCPDTAILLLLDGVEDPRNLGALIRTAAGAGVAGVVLPGRRTAGLSETAAKAASGALEQVPVSRVGNLVSFINLLKEKDFWVLGLHAGDGREWDRIDYPRRMALVAGGEGRGLRRLVRERCDQIVSIPLAGGLESLNVSVAVGVCLFEALRRRRAAAGFPKGE